MIVIKRDELEKNELPGRVIQKAVGKDSFSQSSRMTVGFARYSEASGPMQPHHHAEEVVYIIDARRGWVETGPDPEHLGSPVWLEPGMALHFPPLEWHVFRFEENGYIDLLFIYGQVENIRPEEMQSS